MPDIAGVGDTNGDGLSDFLMATNLIVSLINGRARSEWPTSGLASVNSIARLQGDGRVAARVRRGRRERRRLA